MPALEIQVTQEKWILSRRWNSPRAVWQSSILSRNIWRCVLTERDISSSSQFLPCTTWLSVSPIWMLAARQHLEMSNIQMKGTSKLNFSVADGLKTLITSLKVTSITTGPSNLSTRSKESGMRPCTWLIWRPASRKKSGASSHTLRARSTSTEWPLSKYNSTNFQSHWKVTSPRQT